MKSILLIDDEEQLRKTAADLDAFLRAMPEVESGAVKVLGPAPAPIERIRARFRMQTLLRAPERPALRRVLTRLVDALDEYTRDGVRIGVDVDPVQML